jgi:probable F420-dependent oxidoreductase
MKTGVIFPQTELAGDAVAVRRFIQACEDLGYDYLLAYDHVLKVSHANREPKLMGPYTEAHPFHDPFVLFAYAAAFTRRLQFATGVLVLPQRPTALVAQQAADLDLLSGERFRLGVGIGWNHVEYAALGQDFRTRASRIEEQIGLLRQFWTQPLVNFQGRFDRIDNAGINPRPRRLIPIWIGGYAEAVFERAGRLADGFIFVGTPATGLERWARVRQHVLAAGRPEQDFGRELLPMQSLELQQAADALRGWQQAGGTHGAISTRGQDYGANVDAHIDYLGRVRALMERG